MARPCLPPPNCRLRLLVLPFLAPSRPVSRSPGSQRPDHHLVSHSVISGLPCAAQLCRRRRGPRGYSRAARRCDAGLMLGPRAKGMAVPRMEGLTKGGGGREGGRARGWVSGWDRAFRFRFSVAVRYWLTQREGGREGGAARRSACYTVCPGSCAFLASLLKACLAISLQLTISPLPPRTQQSTALGRGGREGGLGRALILAVPPAGALDAWGELYAYRHATSRTRTHDVEVPSPMHSPIELARVRMCVCARVRGAGEGGQGGAGGREGGREGKGESDEGVGQTDQFEVCELRCHGAAGQGDL